MIDPDSILLPPQTSESLVDVQLGDLVQPGRHVVASDQCQIDGVHGEDGGPRVVYEVSMFANLRNLT